MVDLVLSIFPGLDLFGMAFEGEGWCVVSGPDVCWGRDVRTFHPPAGVFDGIIGGDPCQSHSTLANLVRAKGLEPRFGDLTPEFQRVVEEAQPRWFLRENVRAAPDIAPEGYAVHSFLLCNSWLDSGNGFGEEQIRQRRFWFGVRGAEQPVDLRQWIQMAALGLPKASGVVAGHGEAPGTRGKMKRQVTEKKRWHSVTGAHTCKERPKGGHGERYTLQDMLRLQGLPEDALDEAPFTMQGKRKLVGNGVAISTGRALARAVLAARRGGHG